MKRSAGLRCNLCGSARYHLVYRQSAETRPDPKAKTPQNSAAPNDPRMPNKIVRCMVCRLVYAVPEGSAKRILREYHNRVERSYVAEEKGLRAQAALVLSKIEDLKKPGRLLHVGCGPGFFMDEARQRGWDVRGVELTLGSKTYCKNRFGLIVHQGSLAKAGFDSASFDAVVLTDVIHNLQYPKETLNEARRLLKGDGLIYVSAPDIDDGLCRFLGGRWWGINKYHLFYFSMKTMREMLGVSGFKIVRQAPFPRIFSIAYWAERIRPYPAPVRLPFQIADRLRPLKSRLINISLSDQVGYLARKARRLDTISDGEDEKKSAVLKHRMKTIAVLPAYNAAKTLEKTVLDIPRDYVDEVILVDDASKDETVKIAKKLGLIVFRHEKNRGYGGNQKTCYDKALERGADIVVMVHPDYQYDPKIIPYLIEPIRRGEADAVFGSRMMKGGALEGGMPLWKHNANILLTAFANVMLGTYLTEYHSGFRAYSKKLLGTVRYHDNSDGFVFDTEIIVQALANRMRIDEVPIRTRYFEEASMIRFWPSVVYGVRFTAVVLHYFFHRRGLCWCSCFQPAN